LTFIPLSAFRIFVAVLLCLISAAVQPASADSEPPVRRSTGDSFAAGRLLVKFRDGITVGAKDEFFVDSDLMVLGQLDSLHVYLVGVPEGEEMALAEQFGRHPAVAYAEPDYIYEALGVPNDPSYATDQWNLPQVNAPAAWDITTGLSEFIIAVIDTGVDLSHPDLAGKIVAGYDFANSDAVPQDDYGHGTHVAGIAAAITDNAVGVAGIAWGARIMPIKVLDSSGYGYTSHIAQGIQWAADHGAQIINLSLGGSSPSSTLEDAVNYAYDRGLLIAAAAGNAYLWGNAASYPAAYPHVVAVAATNDTDEHARYSTEGYYVDIAAPGGDPDSSSDANPRHWIMSTLWRAGSTYGPAAGTSMASPHVAGLAALVWSRHMNWTNDEVEWVIESSAVDRGDPDRDDVYGWGRIDMLAAVKADTPPPPPPPPPPCLAESVHPYGDNSDLTWTLTNPDEEAAYSRLHFRRLETENGFDFVNVKDGNGNVIQPFSGAYAGFWSVAVPGRTVQVQLVSDYIYPAWGFCVDQIETTPPPPPCLAESPHPYSDNSNETWTVTNPDEEATFSRIHFSRLETESGFDLVNVKDGNGNVIQPFSGAYAGGVWSIKVPGRTVQIQLVSDFVYAAWGFCVDQIETLPPPDIDVPLTPIVALLAPGRSTYHTLVIGNTGGSPLDFSLSVVAAAADKSVTPGRGPEPPAASKAASASALPFDRTPVDGNIHMAPPGQAGTHQNTRAYQTSSWGLGAPMSASRYRLAGVTDNHRRYFAIGGNDGAYDSHLNEVYDPVTDSWAALAPMPTARMNIQAASVGDVLYVPGGFMGSSGAYVSVHEAYDIASNTWSTKAPLPEPLSGASATSVGGKVYVFGGYGTHGREATTFQYDPTTDAWTARAVMPIALAYGGAVQYGSHAFVVTGVTTGDNLSPAFLRYDPASDSWAAGPSLNTPRMSPAVITAGDYVYVISGGGCGGFWEPCATAERYYLPAFPNGHWELAHDVIPAPVVGPGSAYAVDRMWLSGGASSNGILDLNQYPDEGLAYDDVTWLSLSPTSGTVPAGGNLSVTLSFDATYLETRAYEANLIITSDDPDETQIIVPVRLEVAELRAVYLPCFVE
jgi:type VII secretion-associated serine protease mycosin